MILWNLSLLHASWRFPIGQIRPATEWHQPSIFKLTNLKSDITPGKPNAEPPRRAVDVYPLVAGNGTRPPECGPSQLFLAAFSKMFITPALSRFDRGPLVRPAGQNIALQICLKDMS
jgi:hypothetical protein